MTPGSGILIEAKGIAWTISGQAVLNDVDMAVREREVVTIIGPNGAGKSSLLRVLMGITQPARGTVTRREPLTIGYVPQHIHVDPALPISVGRFLTLVGTNRARARDALAEVGLGPENMNKPVQALSGGEFRRLLLARAVLRHPDLLVLDEPLSGVDVSGQAELYRLIRRLRDAYGAGVLMVSHDLHLVMAETDHVICLNHHVCCAGHPEQVSRDPAFTELFGSGVAVYTHAHDHVHEGENVVPMRHPERHDGGTHR